MSAVTWLIFFVLFGASLGNKDQIPKPHDPGAPVLYPENFCEKNSKLDEFDFIVIGSGPAGTTVSRRLAEDPNHKVLLLEAGDDPPSNSDIPSNFETVTPARTWNISPEKSGNACTGYPNEKCLYTLAMILGGCSVINGMSYVRGNKEDYNEWERDGCPGWGYKTLLPYFRKLENFVNGTMNKKYHHKGGPLTTTYFPEDPQTLQLKNSFKEALAENNIPFNYDINGESQIGFGEETGMVEANGYRSNIAKSYLMNIPDNLKICKKSLVTKLEVKSNKVQGVEFIYNETEKREAKARREYILAGGPANTPQILERSGIGDRKVLKKAGVELVHELKGVGRNLQEQYANTGCYFTGLLGTTAASNPLSIALPSYPGFLNLTDYSNPVPDVQLMLSLIPPVPLKPAIQKQLKELKTDGRMPFIGSSFLLRQKITGAVHILGTDPLKPPMFDPNQYSSSHDLKLQAESCRFFRKILGSKKMEKHKIKPYVLKECRAHKFNSDEEIICAAKLVPFPLYHLAGTTKMGSKKDPMAVVDTRLKVHGITNLRVVDLSVMNRVPRGNTEIPTVAIAERAADIIKEDNKKA